MIEIIQTIGASTVESVHESWFNDSRQPNMVFTRDWKLPMEDFTEVGFEESEIVAGFVFCYRNTRTEHQDGQYTLKFEVLPPNYEFAE
jgi:hypothetical protein